jgi:hypothetical protein
LIVSFLIRDGPALTARRTAAFGQEPVPKTDSGEDYLAGLADRFVGRESGGFGAVDEVTDGRERIGRWSCRFQMQITDGRGASTFYASIGAAG